MWVYDFFKFILFLSAHRPGIGQILIPMRRNPLSLDLLSFSLPRLVHVLVIVFEFAISYVSSDVCSGSSSL